MFGICGMTSCGKKGCGCLRLVVLGGSSWMRREKVGLGWVMREVRGRKKGREG